MHSPDHSKTFFFFSIIGLILLMATTQEVASQGFTSVTALDPINIDAGLGTPDKSQSKVFFHDGKHYAVLASYEEVISPDLTIPEGTNLFRLDGTSWTYIETLVGSKGRADIKVVGDVVHVFVFRNSTSFLISLQYNASTQTFEPWSPRPNV